MKITVSQNGMMSAENNGEVLFASSLPELIWRYEGDEAWIRSTPDKISVCKESNECYKIDMWIKNINVFITLTKGESYWQFEGGLNNKDIRTVELARFSYINGDLFGKPNFYAMAVMGLRSMTFKPDGEFPSAKKYVEDIWKNCNVKWERLNDPIHMESNWGSSTDVGCYIWDKDCTLTAGFTGPGTAFGEIGYGMGEKLRIYCSVLLDNIIVKPDTQRKLENLMLTFSNKYDGLKKWAVMCKNELGSRVSDYSLTGYCSWYQMYRNITPEHFGKATEEYAVMPKTPGGRTVQLDDGFQRMPGDWRPNSRFEKQWNTLAENIEKSGAVPGLWLAPTAIYSGHDIVKNKDMVQTMDDGSPAITFNNWKWCMDEADSEHKGDGKTWYLELDHPEVKKFIYNIISDAVKEGFKYLKLDFTYPVSTARAAYDRTKTSFETLRDLFALCREAAGDDVMLCACIGGIFRYPVGYCDTARLASDNLPDFDESIKNLSDNLLRMVTGGIWWNGDLDVFYMRSNDTSLTDEENWLFTGTFGLLGSVFVTSDLVSQWDSKAMERVSLFWNEKGVAVPTDVKIFEDSDGLPKIIVAKHRDNRILIGFYNLEKTACDASFDLNSYADDLHYSHISPFDKDTDMEISGSVITLKSVPSHGLRIVEIR